jgi:hypothetical protein
MARIRTIKPEFWVDDQIVELDYATRLLFIGLWNFVDDEGYVEYKSKRIKMQIFPADSLDVSGMLTNLLEMGRLARFTSDQGELLRVVNWDRHQKISHPSPTRFTGIQAGVSVNAPESSGAFLISPDGSGLKGRERKGKEGKGKDQNPPAPSVLASVFDDAWKHWPKKVERKQALDRFKAAVKRYPGDAEHLGHDISVYGDAYAATTERQFVPALGVWLAGDRWTDELPQPRQSQQQPLKQSRGAQALEFAMQLPEGGNEIGSKRDRPTIGGGVEY